MQYELCYLVAELKEPEIDKIKENIMRMVEKEGGKWQEGEWRDKRKMAYKIKGENRGIYVANRFNLPEKDSEEHKSDAIQNISKQMKLNQDILRFIVVKTDELPTLKSREEMTKHQAPKPKYKGEKPKPIKIEQPEKKESEDKKSKSIDEKLEEILNI